MKVCVPSDFVVTHPPRAQALYTPSVQRAVRQYKKNCAIFAQRQPGKFAAYDNAAARVTDARVAAQGFQCPLLCGADRGRWPLCGARELLRPLRASKRSWSSASSCARVHCLADISAMPDTVGGH